YEIDADPSYLFDTAQAYRLAKNCREAASYYRLFLARAVDPPNLDKVRGYIERMEACTETSPPPDSLPPEPPPPRAVELPVPPPPRAAITTRVDAGGSRRRLGIAIAATGS